MSQAPTVRVGGPPGPGSREAPDVETSSDEYARRFAGPTGEWMLQVQERIVVQMLARRPGARLLDVGGGHGQLANPLCRLGYDVTVLASGPRCRNRVAAAVEAGLCRFLVGDLLGLPFRDRSFEGVLSFRLLTHCREWRRLVAELCRVADGAVIVDFPTTRSLNALAPMLFGAKKRLEGNTRTWTLFRPEEVVAEFRRNGFRLRRRAKQFFLPMVLHRVLRLRPVSGALEGVCRGLGLTGLWGSPVIVEMVRDGG